MTAGLLNLMANDSSYINKKKISSLCVSLYENQGCADNIIRLIRICDIFTNICFLTKYSDIKVEYSPLNISFDKIKIEDNLYLYFTNLKNKYITIMNNPWFDLMFQFNKPIIKYYWLGCYLDHDDRNKIARMSINNNLMYENLFKLIFINKKFEIYNIRLDGKNNTEQEVILDYGKSTYHLQNILLKIKLLDVDFIDKIIISFNGITQEYDNIYMKYIDKLNYDEDSNYIKELIQRKHQYDNSHFLIKDLKNICLDYEDTNLNKSNKFSININKLKKYPNDIKNIIKKYIPENTDYSISFTNNNYGGLCARRIDKIRMKIYYKKDFTECLNRTIIFTTCEYIK